VRVLLASSHGADPTYGGAERYIADLALGLARRGHEVGVLSAFPYEDDLDLATWTLHENDWRGDPLRRIRNHVGDTVSAPWPAIGRVLSEFRPDVVHTSNLPGIGSGIWEAGRRADAAVVHTLHDYHLLCPRTSLIRRDGTACRPSPLLCGVRTRRLMRWSDAVRRLIAGSHHLLDTHDEWTAGIPRQVIRLPLAPLAAQPLRAPSTPPAVLGYLGALTTTKGVGLLLDAAPRLAAAGIELRVAGEGPLAARVRESGVTYAGRVAGAAKLRFIADADLAIVPSLWDEPSGPPYVVCEWLAAGRPVLTTRRGGLAEAAKMSGVTAFEADVDSLTALAASLREPSAWRAAIASVPPVSDESDVDRWLTEHEGAYRAAQAEERP
jgi:glycosyltransferase involved in cell wall biosynthesis